METRVLGIFTFLTLFGVYSTSAQMSKKLYSPMKADIPFIKCVVCTKGVKHVYRKARTLREELPKHKFTEEKLQDLVEKACKPDKFEGEWIAMLDVEEKDDELTVTEQGGLGSCKAECRTLAKACEETMGEADVDIAEELWKDDLSLSKLINQVCYTESNACVKTKEMFKSGTRKDEVFQVMSEDERKAQEYMKRAGDMPGMPGMQMYSREEMEDMVKGQGNDNEKDDKSSSYTAEDYRHSQASIIWQTFVQVFYDIWSWIKKMLGYETTTSKEL